MSYSDAAAQQPQPSPQMRDLDRLVGTREVSGGATGTVSYEWMDGGFLLHYDADYELIASVTGQPVEWVVARGSLS